MLPPQRRQESIKVVEPKKALSWKPSLPSCCHRGISHDQTGVPDGILDIGLIFRPEPVGCGGACWYEVMQGLIRDSIFVITRLADGISLGMLGVVMRWC